MVLPPILDNFEISFKSETPLINDAKINGTAINFNKLINIFPKGLIQSTIICFPQLNCINSTAKSTPNAIPNKICQCNASFFI